MDTVTHSTISKRAVLAPAVYSLAEVAALLHVSYTTAHELAQRDALPVESLKIGRVYKFRRSDVDRYLGISDAATVA